MPMYQLIHQILHHKYFVTLLILLTLYIFWILYSLLSSLSCLNLWYNFAISHQLSSFFYMHPLRCNNLIYFWVVFIYFCSFCFHTLRHAECIFSAGRLRQRACDSSEKDKHGQPGVVHGKIRKQISRYAGHVRGQKGSQQLSTITCH